MFPAFYSACKVCWANLTSKNRSMLLQAYVANKPSASPLNAQAAELWDTDQEEFKRHVLARHQDLDDE